MPPTAGVYVSLVRHAPIPSLHGGAQWTLDKEMAQDQNTATAVQVRMTFVLIVVYLCCLGLPLIAQPDFRCVHSTRSRVRAYRHIDFTCT